MKDENKKIRLRFVISMTGAMIAYYIGASTGSGQEFFQAYATQGAMGMVGVIIVQVLLAALALVIILTCQKHQLDSPKDCFIFFLGKYVGTVIYYYTVAFVFCSLVQLISGTGYIVSQYYGISHYIGSVVLTLLLIASVCFGFKRLLEIISAIAPFIVVVMFIVLLIGLINGTDGIAKGSEMLLAADNVSRIGSTWWGSTILHFTYLILFFASYYVSCYTVDRGATKKETVLWVAAAFTILGIVCFMMIASQIANASLTIGSQAPNVSIAAAHAPKLGIALVVIIVLASYTTTAPIALICAEYFAKPETKRYRIMGIIIVILGFGVSCLGSYAQIINVLVSVSGWIGVGICIFAAIYRIYRKVTDKETAKPAAE